MSVTREELAAFADGELDPQWNAEIERAVAADPVLAREVAVHRALRARLSTHYAPILDERVSGRMAAMLQRQNNVVDLAKPRESRSAALSSIPRWEWIAGSAIAASIVLALLIPRDFTPESYAGQRVAVALNNQLVATQPADAPVRILLSFRGEAGAYCRAYTAAEQGEIACKDAQGWQVKKSLNGRNIESGEYRRASSVSAELMAHVQEMAKGPALDAEQEAEAKRSGWKSDH